MQPFFEGLAYVRIGEKVGYIDKTRNIIYKEVGYIDKTGNIIYSWEEEEEYVIDELMEALEDLILELGKE